MKQLIKRISDAIPENTNPNSIIKACAYVIASCLHDVDGEEYTDEVLELLPDLIRANLEAIELRNHETIEKSKNHETK